MKTLWAVLVVGCALIRIAPAEDAAVAAPTPAPFAPEFMIGHGVNLGNMLESPKEAAWGQTVREDYFPTIAQAGFTVIRVPICWSAHVGVGPDYSIDATFLSRVDWVVAQAEKAGLKAILDYHNDDALMKNPDANSARFIATWKQIAEHYKDAPPSILFELLNEPNDKLDAAKWNDLLAKALAAVRASNPTRVVIVGPVGWNGSWALPKLVLPDSDPHLLVTFHFYDPFHFTHQDASWVEGSSAWLGTKWGTEADKKAITDSFDTAAKWGTDHHRPMFLGEFGAYCTSPIEGRARWTAFVARTAESHAMPWTYWEFCSGFGAYDPVAKQWRPPLLDALLGK